MPWYDYQCEKCGAVFEVQRAMTDDSKVKCAACGSSRTVQIYSPAPVVFKGSGFYVTDSNGRSKQSAIDVPAKPASNGDTSATPSDTADKPAEKPADKPAETAGSAKGPKPNKRQSA